MGGGGRQRPRVTGVGRGRRRGGGRREEARERR
jgi:hypothetical protein